MRKISSALATGASVLTSGAAWAQTPMNGPWNHHMMWWGGGDGGWYGMLLGPLFMIVILTVLIGAVLFFFRGPQNSRPLDILKERYARGEIDKAEFDERRHTLGV